MSALRRLLTEYKELTEHPPDGIIAGPIDESNMLRWEAILMGPEGTSLEGGVFRALLVFPVDYPMSPPSMRFISEMWHPNVYPDGRVCCSILHSGVDPSGYESASERWSPVQSVEKVLLSVLSMLCEPNSDSPANLDAAKMWRERRDDYDRRVKLIVRKSLGL